VNISKFMIQGGFRK